MLGDVQKLSIAQKDGASPAALGGLSALGESGAPAPRAGFKGAMRVGAARGRRRLL